MYRIRRFIIAILIASVASLPIGYCNNSDSISTSPQFQKYVLQVPIKLKNSDPKLPLIVFLHGAGTTSYEKLQLQVKTIVAHQAEHSFIFFAPLFTDPNDWQSTLNSLKTMVDQVISLYPVDSSRIYLTGISMGGNFGWQFAVENPELFAAYVSLAGGPLEDHRWNPSTLRNVGRLKNVPVRVYHGDQDNTVFLQQSQIMVNALKQAGGDATLIVLSGRDHNIFDMYGKDEIYAWLFQYHKD